MVEIDNFKKELAKSNGFDVLTIWSDISIEKNIEICEEFIKNKLNHE